LQPSLADWGALQERLGPACLRVATYNLHGCVGSDARRDPLRIAAVIKELDCDTIGLQEVYGLDELAAALGMRSVAGPPYVWHGRHVGNALLTTRRVLSMRHYDYSWKGREPRSMLDVELEAAGGPVRVLVVHFGIGARERRFQLHKLAELLRETPKDEPLVVLGDVNEWLPLSRPLRALHDLLGRSHAARTFPARWPLFALDRIWVRPRRALLVLEAHRSALARQASDHLPLRALIAAGEASIPAESSLPLPASAKVRGLRG
jgi:endonuclease/exonuclease/phosphatase family metal-dependent hydrolase